MEEKIKVIEVDDYTPEYFVDVKGYEGKYRVSNKGRVYSLLNDMFRVSTIGGRGYYEVGLHNNGKRKTVKIHRLIANHFISNPKKKKEVNHIDGDKTNNSISNLEWCTRRENNKHARLTGLNKDMGETHHNAKLKESDILMIRELRSSGLTHREIASKFNVTRKCITSILNKKRWSHVE